MENNFLDNLNLLKRLFEKRWWQHSLLDIAIGRSVKNLISKFYVKGQTVCI